MSISTPQGIYKMKIELSWRIAAFYGFLLTFALQFSSNSTLVDLTSLCKIRGAAASWRYSKPLAAPSAIVTLRPQSKVFPEAPSRQSLRLPLDMYSNTSSLSVYFPWRAKQKPIKGTT